MSLRIARSGTMRSFSSETIRLEKDSLGSVEVLMSNKWKAQTQRAINNFPISGWKLPPSFIKQLALLKACAAKVNGEMGLLDPAKSRCIADIANQIYRGEPTQHFPVDVFQTGSGTSTNMNINEVISIIAHEEHNLNIHPNDDVNRCQSSNDTIPTAISLACVHECQTHLLPAITCLISSIQKRALDTKGIIKSGRTHLMDAVPLSLSDELTTWATQLQFSYDIINQAVKSCYSLPIGGTAIGTGINTAKGFDDAIVKELNSTTGIPFTVAENKGFKISSQDHISHLSSALRSLCSSLFKICNDLRWMHSGPSAGLREIVLPPTQPGSSIMPGKVNPVVCESALMACIHIMGSDQIITQCGHLANFQLHLGLPLVAYHILHNIAILGNTCHNVATKAVEGFVIDKRHIDDVMSKNAMLVTGLSTVIGYEKSYRIIQKVLQDNRSILDVAIEETDIAPGRLAQLLDPTLMARPFH